jgi:hypothetical protein
MSYATIQVTPVTPRIGAIISGIDLATTLRHCHGNWVWHAAWRPARLAA